MRDYISGFWPIALHTAAWCGEQREYPILPAYTTAIGKGDVVILASGYVNRAADTSARPLGVFNGVTYVDPSGNRIFSEWWPGTANCTDIRASIVDHPFIEMAVRAKSGTALTAAMLGQVAELDAGAAVTGPLGLSTMTLDLATAAAAPGSSDEQALIVDFDRDDIGKESAVLRVKFMRHQML